VTSLRSSPEGGASPGQLHGARGALHRWQPAKIRRDPPVDCEKHRVLERDWEGVGALGFHRGAPGDFIGRDEVVIVISLPATVGMRWRHWRLSWARITLITLPVDRGDKTDSVATNKYLRGGHGDGVDVVSPVACRPGQRRRKENGDDDRCQVGPARRWLSAPVRSLGSRWTGWWVALVGFGPLAGLPPFSVSFLFPFSIFCFEFLLIAFKSVLQGLKFGHLLKFS
jgi:hypothetical protein